MALTVFINYCRLILNSRLINLFIALCSVINDKGWYLIALPARPPVLH